VKASTERERTVAREAAQREMTLREEFKGIQA
jgi:hypothetical protein